jgi:solute carrier family 25, member 34/35
MLLEFATGSMAAMSATLFTNPMEVIKNRFQVQAELQTRSGASVVYRNIVQGAWVIARYEGISALQKGLAPALAYQCLMNGARLGLYPVLERMVGINTAADEAGLLVYLKKMTAATTAGAAGALIGAPMYLLKTRQQIKSTKGAVESVVGYQHKLAGGTLGSLKNLFVGGLKETFRGVSAQVLRVTTGSATQLLTYDYAKHLVFVYFPERHVNPVSPTTILMASSLAGLAVTTVMQPVDIACTRVLNQPTGPQGEGLYYRGAWDCLLKTLKAEGMRGLFKGWSASYLRVGPHTALTFFFLETYRAALS